MLWVKLKDVPVIPNTVEFVTKMFSPIVLKHGAIIHRSDVLFSYCSICERPICWQPVGGAVFASNCCNKVYNAKPIGMEMRFYQIGIGNVDMTNVRLLRRKKDKPT